MIKVQRRFVTLVEMLIVIGLLTLFIGVVGINVATALREQKFRTEVGLIVERLRLAQNLMLIQNSDVFFRVKVKGDEGFEMWLEVDGGIPEAWKPTLERSKHLLTTIHRFQFGELNEGFPTTPGEFKIRFQSGGTVMSRGLIRLSTHEEEDAPTALYRDICLKGYPSPIVSAPRGVACEEDEEETDRLTFFTLEELKEDVIKAREEEQQKEQQETEQQPPTEIPQFPSF